MRRTKHAVSLSDEQRAQLRMLVGREVASARRLMHARILLKADQGDGGAAWADAAIAGAVEVPPATGAQVPQLFVAEGLEAAVAPRAPRREYPRGPRGAVYQGAPPRHAPSHRLRRSSAARVAREGNLIPCPHDVRSVSA